MSQIVQPGSCPFPRRAAAFLAFLLLLLFMSVPLFAQSAALTAMDTVAQDILGAMRSPLVRTILVIALCGSAIAFAVNKDNQRLRFGAIAIIVAAVILMAAPEIIDMIWKIS